MFTLTKAKALEIQTQQIAHYAKVYPEIDVAGIVAKATTADQLPDDGELDIVLVNRHVPRGGTIEMLIGRFSQKHY